jgi:hypothetical protein
MSPHGSFYTTGPGFPPKIGVGYNGLQFFGAKGTPCGDAVLSRKGDGPTLYAGQRLFGTPVRFRLDEEWRRSQPRVMLVRLGFRPEQSPGVDPIQQLIHLINRRADELPLPDGCIVMRSQRFHPVIWSDPLTALAILSKSSDTLWLRSKTPSLIGAMYWQSKTLIVPPSFVPYLPEVNK